MKVGAFGYLLKNGSVMLILRKNEPYAGTWSLPGGAMEKKESIDDTVVREFYEETGLKVKSQVRIGEQLFKFDGKWFLAHVCGVQYLSGEIRAGEDVSDAKLFSKKHIKDITIAPPIEDFFDRYDLWP